MFDVVFIFAWYDFWIGIFVDRKKKEVYVFLIPCVGLKLWYNRGLFAPDYPVELFVSVCITFVYIGVAHQLWYFLIQALGVW